MEDLVAANRILVDQGVLDGYGHVSVRHDRDPNRYLMSRSLAPELVTWTDILEYDLDSNAIDARGRTTYLERFIHGEIYRARPDVKAVVHTHSPSLIPFGVTGKPLRPIAHVCGVIGPDIPTWDIREKFGATDHLVLTMEQGRDLARCLGPRTAALMKRHGCVVVGRGLREAVNAAVYLQVNAKLLLQSLQLGTPDYLTPTEIELCTSRQVSPLALDRAWEYWSARAGAQDL